MAFFHTLRRDGYHWLDGMRALLRDCAAAHRTVIDSNYPVWIADAVRLLPGTGRSVTRPPGGAAAQPTASSLSGERTCRGPSSAVRRYAEVTQGFGEVPPFPTPERAAEIVQSIAENESAESREERRYMSIPTTKDTGLHGVIRTASDKERSTVQAVFERHGTPLPNGAVAVVFAYPGHGVGERHHRLSGCTSQMLLLSSASAGLSRLGITVAAASTEPPEKHAHAGELGRIIARFTEDDAEAVPHTDLPEGRVLLRWTMVLGGPHDGLLVTDITDSVAHTRAVIDLLTADRLRAVAPDAGTDVIGESA
ncbi:hypothetical protein [Streptomyces sp. NBC_01435]|uniref:hypothetical protein n=1 Tax=Streptomyces sp. NBC_01435 TaxID=2903865 RepID=UPI002E2FD741|nr:hypothetical protein [Streptomyces sp. NBC_01435]